MQFTQEVNEEIKQILSRKIANTQMLLEAAMAEWRTDKITALTNKMAAYAGALQQLREGSEGNGN